jgi:hypothetical protein
VNGSGRGTDGICTGPSTWRVTVEGTTAAIDMPLALAIVGLGALILVVPSAVPGLTPAL